MDALFIKLVRTLQEKNLKLGACESFTGGMFSNYVTNVSGSSNVFLGSFVSYSDDFKNQQLGISQQLIKKYGSISQECAEKLAINTQRRLDSDISVSFTGMTGVNGSEDNVGFISIYCKGEVSNFKFNYPKLTRVQFKEHAAKVAAHEILNIIDRYY